MGKVYEALLRAESEDATLDFDDETDDLDAIDVEDEREIRNPRGMDRDVINEASDFGRDLEQDFDAGRGVDRDDERRPARSTSRFSFLRYSLGTGSVFDSGGARPDTASSAL